MSLSRRTVVAGAVFCLLAPGMAFADAAAAAFVESIYKSYEKKGFDGVRLDGRATLERYFTPSLAGLIEKDFAESKRRDEPPLLNGDPFIDAQDWEIARVEIAVKESGKDRAGATVRFVNFGERNEVRLALLKTPAGWRIDDIHWREGSLRGLYKP